MKRIANLRLNILMLAVLMSAGCFSILEVDQPASADAGSNIEIIVTGRTNSDDSNAKFGILGMVFPVDWTVNSVTYDGDLGSGTMRSLAGCVVDYYESNVDSCWADTLESRYPTADNMHWEVWEANEGYAPTTDTNYVDFTIDITVGSTAGTYGLGYLFSESALDIIGLTPDYEDYGYDHDTTFNNILEVVAVGVDDEELNPLGFSLMANYPNPFNPETMIEYTVDQSGPVQLTVFDINGRLVTELVNKIQQPGAYQVVFQGDNLPSGTYFYRLTTSNQTETRKMVLLR